MEGYVPTSATNMSLRKMNPRKMDNTTPTTGMTRKYGTATPDKVRTMPIINVAKHVPMARTPAYFNTAPAYLKAAKSRWTTEPTSAAIPQNTQRLETSIDTHL